MNRLMTHVVAGYPNPADCIKLLKGMDKMGVAAVEVQLPFSDPIADGETIMRANDEALAQGVTTEKSFSLIKSANLITDVYIMSYLQKVVHFGVDNFCAEAINCGGKGLIIPDLPIDSPEYDAVKKAAEKHKLSIIPVVSPGMSSIRLKKIVSGQTGIIYLTSRRGITGKALRLDPQAKKTAIKIKRYAPTCQLAIGFGVATKQDVRIIAKQADLAVVGSAIINRINQSGIDGALEFLKKL